MLRNDINFLPFRNKTGAWRRIEVLEAENQQIVITMRTLAEHFITVVAAPREIYLCVQQVRSGMVYIRWRKRGVRGNQKYLMLNTNEGKNFLLYQHADVKQLYQRFNTQTLELNLAYSLRITEIKRIKKYLGTLL